MTDIIFLHGTWHQPAHFDDLVERLARVGLRSAVPDLHGLRPAEGKQVVEEVISTASRPPLLVAHSAGGIIAGAVEGADYTLYLAGWILDVGESPGKLIHQDAVQSGSASKMISLPQDSDGNLLPDPSGVKAAFYADCSDEVADRAIALLRPEAPAIFDDSPPVALWRGGPSHYLAGGADQSMLPGLSEIFAARCDTSETWPTSHSAYLSQPGRLVELIRSIIQ